MKYFLCIIFFLGSNLVTSAQKHNIILDADTGNEVDDPYAIMRLLVDSTVKITALNATHWQTSQWSIPETMENSHRLNQLMLGYLDLSIPTFRGGAARMYDWGEQARHSAASYEIIRQARGLSGEKKLIIVALGALTNVASAIYIDPTIAEKIHLFWLGSTYDFENSIMKKLDFNCVMDVQALEVVLQSSAELTIIPVNIAAKMTFDYMDTEKKLSNRHPSLDFLIERWKHHLDGGRNTRVIWDLAIVECLVKPELCTFDERLSSPENGSRPIRYIRDIDVRAMKADFYHMIEEYFRLTLNEGKK